MFYFPGCTLYVIHTISAEAEGFPHSEISGSQVARHLPETYRSHATSFIAILSQGIHHTLLNFPLGNLKTTYTLARPLAQMCIYPVIFPLMRNLYHRVTLSCYIKLIV